MQTIDQNLLNPPGVGDLVEGKIIGKGQSTVYVDLGSKGTGIIYGREFHAAKSELKSLKMGDKLVAKIIDLETDNGHIDLSLTEAGKEKGQEQLKQKKDEGSTIKVKIVGANRGGLLAEADGLRGFLPVSQLSSEHYPRVEGADRNKILIHLQQLVGQELEVKILSMDTKKDTLVFSEKATETEKIKEILKQYKAEDVVEGEITGIVDFGAFIRFYADSEEIEGLIHISELDWQLIENPVEIIKVGQKVKAKIIEITEDGRVSLSLKALKKDPWLGIEEKYKKGDVVEGQVTRINPFGAFVEIEPKIQGLAHISEFGTKSEMENKLQVGQKYKFKILQIEPKEHKMTLTLEKE